MLHPFSSARICQDSRLRGVFYGVHVWVATNAQGCLCLQGCKQEKEAEGRGDEISESTEELQGAVGIAEADVS